MSYITRNIARNLTKNVTLSRNLTAPFANGLKQEHRYMTSGEQPNLLRYPVNPLDKTFKLFLKSATPFLNEKELKETKLEICNFVHGVGGGLQKHLEQTADREENWLETRWLKTEYLRFRAPVMIHSSPGMIFPTQNFKNEDEYLLYTVKMIYGCLKYKENSDQRNVPVVKMGDFELDNSQFYKIFGTCRLPGVKEDTLEYHPKSRHIVVICKNHFYKLPVYSNGDRILHPVDVLLPALRNITRKDCDEGVPIGILSADKRDNWGKAYKELHSIKENVLALEAIHKSIFTVSLDKTVPVDKGCNEMVVAAEQCIHGGGSKYNTGNRWFDKTIQIVVNPNGVNGICFEHSPAEGGLISALTDFVTESMADKYFFSGSALADSIYEKPCKLILKSNKKILKYIEKAKKNCDALIKDFSVNVLHFKSFGSSLPRELVLGTDSFIQIAMGLAFYNLHKRPGAQYESAHHRIFVNGRTETIRVCSIELLKFCKAMNESKPDDSKCAALLRLAFIAHRSYSILALNGRGVDRHLLGLKAMAHEHNVPLPNFFSLPAVKRSEHWDISSSQVTSEFQAFMSYGTLAPDGYGCCYSPRTDDMFFAISSWLSCKDTDSRKYAQSLCAALEAIRTMLLHSETKKKK